MVHLPWIKPQAGESLSEYGSRMATAIDTTEPFILMGISMGGMIVSELSSHLDAVHAIILSSTRGALNMGRLMDALRKAILSILVVLPLLRKGNHLVYRLFGAWREEERDLLDSIMRNTDQEFFRWAVKAIREWDYSGEKAKVYHIHGDRDYVIPLKYCRPDSIVPGAGHMMVSSHAAEVSTLIAARLGEYVK